MNIEEIINSVEVTINDLLETNEAVNQLPPEDRHSESRVHFLLAKRFKGQPNKAMAINRRLVAMSIMVESGKLPGLALPDQEDGCYNIAKPVWQATATEQLMFVENRLCFNEESFLQKVLSCAEPEGNA